MNWESWQQHREEIVWEVELNRLAKALREGDKTSHNRVYLLSWELRRAAGLMRKLTMALKSPRKGANP